MQHSIAAKYAARPAARFVRTSPRARERRLGLRSAVSFRSAARHATVLRDAELSPLVRLRARWRSVQPARPYTAAGGRLHPVVVMRWARFGAGRARRVTPASPPAPWRA